MKLPIKEIIYLGVYAIIFIFIIGAMFHFEFFGKSGMLSAVGEVYEANIEDETVSENKNRINDVTAAEAPQIRYVGRNYTQGETFLVNELFEVKTAEADHFVPATVESGFSLSVQDIRDQEGNSFLADSMEDNETAEELSAVMYNRSTGTICFNQSGVFVIRVLVWGANGRTALGEITLPVETG